MTPSPYEAPALAVDARPRVIVWFRVYAAFMTLLYLATFGLGLVMANAQPTTTGPAPALAAMLIVSMSVMFATFYGVAIFVPFKPWGWTIGVIAIGIGLASCTIVVALPLILQWTRPEVKAAFRRL